MISADTMRSLVGTWLAELAHERANADDVYHVLMDRNVTGLRGDPCECPIAVYLNSRVAELRENGLFYPPRFNVMGKVVEIHYIGFMTVNVPETIQRFIRAFDDLAIDFAPELRRST